MCHMNELDILMKLIKDMMVGSLPISNLAFFLMDSNLIKKAIAAFISIMETAE